jgi:hypothetical protein
MKLTRLLQLGLLGILVALRLLVWEPEFALASKHAHHS